MTTPSALTTTPTPRPIDTAFEATITQGEGPGAWTLVTMPGSGEFFGTRRPVRVVGTMDDTPFEATLLPMGDGTHMVPIRAALRKAIGKSGGDAVSVRLTQRLT